MSGRIESVLEWMLLLSQPILDAYVALRLWQWFAMPLGAPAIGYAHAAGITISVKWLIMDVRIKRADTTELAPRDACIAGLVVSISVFLIGAILHWLMVRA